MTGHEHDHGHGAHDQHPHGQPGHVHDDSCAVAHGTADSPRAQAKVLAAVFATPVASYLLRYGADVGYRAILIEPDPERAKSVAADGFELTDELDAAAAAAADVVLTDHHRPELGPQLRDALAAGARWVGIMGNPRHEPPHVAALTELGVPADEISKVHRPIGVNIGSHTPAEIAIATIAGLIADRNGKPGGFEF
ncbi:MAG TPA: XdhC family protein [Streptosporangiaceae bacterium]|nr:XdhC family protein [Streptosporangiaceae bacterium]